MTYVYLASPYSHQDASMREARYSAARDATAWMLAQRIWVYSPIVHCHELCKVQKLPTDAAYWQDYNFAMLRSAKELVVLNIPGWLDSKGVAAEIDFARQRNIHIRMFMQPSAAQTGAPTAEPAP